MKKIIFALSVFFFLLVFTLIPKASAYTNHPLDHILSYDIWVTPNDDATLELEYDIKWKVLDSNNGGVTWVKIGVPNKYCSNVVNLSSDIKKIGYTSIDGGTYVRCDMKKEFMAGEIIDIHFKCHQTHMFTFKEDESTKTELTTFKFIPGWFDEIEIDLLTIHWYAKDVYYNDAKDEKAPYYIWSTSLGQGQKTSASVSYDTKVFPNINRDDTYVGPTDDSSFYKFLTAFFTAIIVVFVGYAITRIFTRPSYYRTRGFYPAGRRFWLFRPFYYGVDNRGSRIINPYVSSGGSGHSGHSCACACACACAGGGRAGCSKKDFYKGKIKIDDVIDKLN